MAATRVSAIVLHFRTWRATAQCLSSLRESGISDVWVVDNSADHGMSLRRLQSAMAHLKQTGFQACYLEPGRNLGFAAGVNLAAARALAAGPTRLLLINSDAVLNRDAFASMYSALDSGLGAASPMVLQQGESSNHFDVDSYGYQPWLGLYVKPTCVGAFRYLSCACVMISELVAKAELLDTRFFFYGEDVALGLYLEREGIRFKVDRSAFIDHVGSQSSKNGSRFYEYHMNLAHLELVRICFDKRSHQAVGFVCRAVTLTARAALRSFRFRSVTPVRMLAMALFDFMTGKRRDLTPSPVDLTQPEPGA